MLVVQRSVVVQVVLRVPVFEFACGLRCRVSEGRPFLFWDKLSPMWLNVQQRSAEGMRPPADVLE